MGSEFMLSGVRTACERSMGNGVALSLLRRLPRHPIEKGSSAWPWPFHKLGLILGTEFVAPSVLHVSVPAMPRIPPGRVAAIVKAITPTASVPYFVPGACDMFEEFRCARCGVPSHPACIPAPPLLLDAVCGTESVTVAPMIAIGSLNSFRWAILHPSRIGTSLSALSAPVTGLWCVLSPAKRGILAIGPSWFGRLLLRRDDD